MVSEIKPNTLRIGPNVIAISLWKTLDLQNNFNIIQHIIHTFPYTNSQQSAILLTSCDSYLLQIFDGQRLVSFVGYNDGVMTIEQLQSSK